MNTLFYPPVSQEVFYRVKDSDMNMSYLTQILAVRNLILHVLHSRCFITSTGRVAGAVRLGIEGLLCS